jgi:hypothetical protein
MLLRWWYFCSITPGVRVVFGPFLDFSFSLWRFGWQDRSLRIARWSYDFGKTTCDRVTRTSATTSWRLLETFERQSCNSLRPYRIISDLFDRREVFVQAQKPSCDWNWTLDHNKITCDCRRSPMTVVRRFKDCPRPEVTCDRQLVLSGRKL